MVHPKAKNWILASKHIIVVRAFLSEWVNTGCFETEARYSAPRFGTAYACRTKQIALNHTTLFICGKAHYSMQQPFHSFPTKESLSKGSNYQDTKQPEFQGQQSLQSVSEEEDMTKWVAPDINHRYDPPYSRLPTPPSLSFFKGTKSNQVWRFLYIVYWVEDTSA